MGRGPQHLHAEVHAGDGPPILLVHGLFSSRAAWAPNLAALCEVATPVVVELWGHGRSLAPDEPEAYAPASYLREFEHLRGELGVDRWFVCGASLGAALTIRYAIEMPERVIGHVFTNSGSALGDEAWVSHVGPAVAADADRLERDGRAAFDAHPLNPARGRRLAPEVRAALVEAGALHDVRGLAATLRHTVPGSSVRSRLGENTRPALAVVGERERAFAEGRAWLERERPMPHLQIVGADAGHAVNLEAATTFEGAVAAFVAKALGSS